MQTKWKSSRDHNSCGCAQRESSFGCRNNEFDIQNCSRLRNSNLVNSLNCFEMAVGRASERIVTPLHCSMFITMRTFFIISLFNSSLCTHQRLWQIRNDPMCAAPSQFLGFYFIFIFELFSECKVHHEWALGLAGLTIQVVHSFNGTLCDGCMPMIAFSERRKCIHVNSILHRRAQQSADCGYNDIMLASVEWDANPRCDAAQANEINYLFLVYSLKCQLKWDKRIVLARCVCDTVWPLVLLHWQIECRTINPVQRGEWRRKTDGIPFEQWRGRTQNWCLKGKSFA